MAKSEGYVSADYLRKAAEVGRLIKERSYELMAVEEANTLLDVGCGPGIDTVELGRRVGEKGFSFGVDLDEEMIREADKHAREQGMAERVIHRVGDVTALPFEDNRFDACRAERLFQVLPRRVEPAQVLSEICRVVRPGGRIVLVDTDWASASVDFGDSRLERALLNFFAETMRPNGYAGRHLFRLMRGQGMEELQVEIHPLIQFDYAQTPFGEWLTGEAGKAQIASEAELKGWKRILEERTHNGCFYSSVCMVMVSGRKPGD